MPFFHVGVSESIRDGSHNMQMAKEYLDLTDHDSEAVSQLDIAAQRAGVEFYEVFALRGIRVDRVEPGLVVCSFKVPPRLTDRAGNFATGAIANLVDVVGNSTVYCLGRPMNVSIDMSISYMSKAKIDDELEITSKRLGQRGRYFGTIVVLKNKATGEIIAEGRHSLFRSNFVPKL
ncbi:acyl-coenzyme A thioesterase 13-like isoform X1 [Rosa chinensis]|nr:acyl-coenzyme A thioesterase 13-like isoform X1 [Rosa chinensis]